MKNYLLIVLFIALYAASAAPAQQEIRYSCKTAEEVYIVWGMDKWQLLLPDSSLPAGSFIKDKLYYTPMEKISEGVFSAKLLVEPGTIIDYVFWITKGLQGKGADVWDTNEQPLKDYHTYSSPNTITVVESKLVITPGGAVNILDYAYILMFISVGLIALVYLVYRSKAGSGKKSKQPLLIIISTAISLMLLLFMIRPSVVGISWDIFSSPASNGTLVMWAGFYDALYVIVLTCMFLVPACFLGRYPLVQRSLAWLFVAMSLISLIFAILNIRIVEMLGKPLNYQWLYYSDFLKSADSKAALTANLSAGYLIRIAAICVFSILIGGMVFLTLDLLARNEKRRRISLTVCCLLCVVYVAGAHHRLSSYNWSYDRLINPVTAFVASVNPFTENPSLFTMQVPDSMQFKKEPGKRIADINSGKIKNVLIFVLESTPAEYIDTYGSRYKATPVISKYEECSITFDNFYAHAPATNLSMVSLLGSVYPWLSYNSFTEEYPAMNIPTISAELKSKGYRTGFFNSADNRYQKAGEFLSYRKFDVVKDLNDNSCGQKYQVEDSKWQFMSGLDDHCSAGELCEWIDEDTSRPFFSVMWTYQTHYPYFINGPQKDYGSRDSIFTRYLNALHYGDSILGTVIDRLQQKKLLESTLIVIVGDHGEAFGRHGQITHAREIYEENLHVPCIFLNPSFAKKRVNCVGGMVDIAPTVVSLLGYQPHGSWQGSDLFAKGSGSRAFFFAPWSDFLFGYREGDFKYIYNATKNETEVYNLKEDPFETKNIAVEKPEALSAAHQRLAGWAQYVNRSTEKILNDKH